MEIRLDRLTRLRSRLKRLTAPQRLFVVATVALCGLFLWLLGPDPVAVTFRGVVPSEAGEDWWISTGGDGSYAMGHVAGRGGLSMGLKYTFRAIPDSSISVSDSVPDVGWQPPVFPSGDSLVIDPNPEPLKIGESTRGSWLTWT